MAGMSILLETWEMLLTDVVIDNDDRELHNESMSSRRAKPLRLIEDECEILKVGQLKESSTSEKKCNELLRRERETFGREETLG